MAREGTNDVNKVSARLFRTTRKVSAIDRVIHKFKELLKNGELKPGNRIPTETELAKSFGTSRGSIREAVKMIGRRRVQTEGEVPGGAKVALELQQLFEQFVLVHRRERQLHGARRRSALVKEGATE